MIGNNPKNKKIEVKEKKTKSLEEDEPPDNRKCILDIESEFDTPLRGRIITVGLLEILEAGAYRVRIFFDRNEQVMLRRVIRCFDQEKYGQLIGFHINFDLRALLGRCMKYQLSASSIFSVPCYDVMTKLKKIKNGIASYNKSGSLEEWSLSVLGKGKMKKDGSIASLYRQGQIDQIIQYNKQDLMLTFELYRRLNMVMGPKENTQRICNHRAALMGDKDNDDLCPNLLLQEEIGQKYQHTTYYD